MSSSEVLRFAGDVNIERVLLVSSNQTFTDIKDLTIGVQIFEDLFSPFISGTLIIKESLDLLNAIPLTGDEYVRLRISTPTLPDGSIDSEFYIYKMSNRIKANEGTLIYELHFISPEAIIDSNKKISKKFSGKPSDIARDILTNKDYGLQTIKPVNVEESSNDVHYISNFWTPAKNLNYLSEVSYNKGQSPTYLFYENRGGFNFLSLDLLYSNDYYVEHFKQDHFQRDTTNSGGDVRNIAEEYKRIKTVSTPYVYDYIRRTENGVVSSKEYSFDITSKNVMIKDYNLFDDWKKHNHTNPYPLYSPRTIAKNVSRIINKPRYWGNFTNGFDSSNAEYYQKRASLLQAIDESKLEITVPGRMQYTVGQKVVVELYKQQPTQKNDDDIIDTMLSGVYLIGALNHYIDREKHECVMEIFKDSLLRDLSKG